MKARTQEANNKLLTKLSLVAVLMFGFGFLMVPFYQKFCEVVGINQVVKADEKPVNTQIDTSRFVKLQFDSSVHLQDGWRLTPLQFEMEVHPGQLAYAYYELENTTDKMLYGQAVPSYAPAQAAPYFLKLDCFCFKQQHYKAGEKQKLQVVFSIDPALPKHINTITLSYTFYKIEGLDKAR